MTRVRYFRNFRFDPESGELRKPDGTLRLAPLPAEFLTMLTDRPGELVSRQELRSALWGDCHLEWEKSLYYCVGQVRQALGDSAKTPQFIENVPKRGYRFLPRVRVGQPKRLKSNPSRTRATAFAVGTALTAAAVLLAWLISSGTSSGPNPERLEADSLVKQGQYLLERPGAENFQRAHHYFADAVKADPSHSRAWSGLARLQFHRFLRGGLAVAKARKSAQTALRLDPSSADAHVVLGDIASLADHDLESSRLHYKMALSLEPDHRQALLHYSTNLSLSGQHEASLHQMEHLLQVDPPSALLMGDAGWAFLSANRASRAEELCRQALRLDPELPHAQECLVYALASRGRTEASLREAQRLLDMLRTPAQEPLASLDDFHRRMIDWYSHRPSSEIRRALHYAALGDHASSIRLLTKAAEQEKPQLILFLSDHRLQPLRDVPEYQSLLLRCGLAAQVEGG